jgi:serine/threonine protein kinase
MKYSSLIEMSVTSVKVCGTGTKGVIAYNIDLSQKKPEWRIPKTSKNLLFKVMTDLCSYRNELKNAKYLGNLDPQQRFFIFPVAAYTLSSDPVLLRYLYTKNPIEKKDFNPLANKMYVMSIPYGGESIYAFKKNGNTLTSQQAKDAISNLLEGLAILHRKDIVHGDPHAHNAVIHIDVNGKAFAKWIDFGEMKTKQNKQSDMTSFMAVITTILNMVPYDDIDETIDAMKTNMRGVAPMSAFDLKTRDGFRSLNNVHRKRTPKTSSSPRQTKRAHLSPSLKKVINF